MHTIFDHEPKTNSETTSSKSKHNNITLISDYSKTTLNTLPFDSDHFLHNSHTKDLNVTVKSPDLFFSSGQKADQQSHQKIPTNLLPAGQHLMPNPEIIDIGRRSSVTEGLLKTDFQNKATAHSEPKRKKVLDN